MSKNDFTKYEEIILPNFEGRKAFVVNGAAFQSNIIHLLASCDFKKAESIDEADVVVFGGGSDIDPSLYGEEKHSSTFFIKEKDEAWVKDYEEAVSKNKVMFGICRGAQFLHALNGGKLYQDVNNHNGRHVIVDLDDDVILECNSMHHQMLIPNEEIDIVAVTNNQVATKFATATETFEAEEGSDPIVEIEAGYYHKTRCFFVQGHPEVGSDEYRSWTMGKLFDFVIGFEEADEGRL